MTEMGWAPANLPPAMGHWEKSAQIRQIGRRSILSRYLS